MVKAQKPKKESSSEASSSSKRPKPQNVLFLSDKEKAKLERLAREDNIANSMKTLGKSAIKASSTHTRMSDELAANEARFLELQQERERNRVRHEVLQEQADNRSQVSSFIPGPRLIWTHPYTRQLTVPYCFQFSVRSVNCRV